MFQPQKHGFRAPSCPSCSVTVDMTLGRQCLVKLTMHQWKVYFPMEKNVINNINIGNGKYNRN